MALQTANQFNLSPDIAGNLSQGVKAGQNIASQFQLGGERVAAQRARTDEEKNRSLVNAALNVSTMPEQEIIPFLESRISSVEGIGGDASESKRALELAKSGRFEELREGSKRLVNIGVRQGIIKPESAQEGFTLGQGQARFDAAGNEIAVGPEMPEGQKETVGTASQRDFQTYLDLQKTDPVKAEMFGRQAGFVRPTEQEKADISVDKATRTEVTKANVARKQGFIDSGIDAADSVGNITRSLELLKTVETGGFDNLALNAKRLFGVEGADEGELSANLGKAMLAQLKPLFGAAFTVNEVEKLERIESQFGKSTEVNKRLLGNALDLAQRAAKRGLAAAEDQDDEFTANEIRSLLANMEATKGGESSKEAAKQTRIRFDAQGNIIQ